MTVTISADGIADLELYFDRFPTVARNAMSIAINDAARDVGMKAARRDITAQVAFPEGYLDRPDRLSVTQYATPTRLEARITGRDRPTSLARFAARGTPVYRRGAQPPLGVTVMVKPGRPEHFASAFLYALKNGNVGFAIKLRPGDTVRGVERYQPIMLWKGVFLLYGPSVNQVFQGVADDIAPEVTSAIEAEFHRQFTRLSGADK